MSCGKNLVDRTIAATGNDAIDFSSASISNGFAGQSSSISGLPSDPHFDDLTVLAQRANGRSQSSIAGRLAMQNNANGCHAFDPWFQELIKFSLGSLRRIRSYAKVNRDGQIVVNSECALI